PSALGDFFAKVASASLQLPLFRWLRSSLARRRSFRLPFVLIPCWGRSWRRLLFFSLSHTRRQSRHLLLRRHSHLQSFRDLHMRASHNLIDDLFLFLLLDGVLRLVAPGFSRLSFAAQNVPGMHL